MPIAYIFKVKDRVQLLWDSLRCLPRPCASRCLTAPGGKSVGDSRFYYAIHFLAALRCGSVGRTSHGSYPWSERGSRACGLGRAERHKATASNLEDVAVPGHHWPRTARRVSHRARQTYTRSPALVPCKASVTTIHPFWYGRGRSRRATILSNAFVSNWVCVL